MIRTEAKVSTSFHEIVSQGQPPSVIVADQKWNPPVLTLYLYNLGGSGEITLAIFVGPYGGRQRFHIAAGDSLTLNLNLSSYPATQVPVVQIVDQKPDYITQTQTFEIPWTQVYTTYATRAFTTQSSSTRTELYTASVTIKESANVLAIIVGKRADSSISMTMVVLSAFLGLFGVVLLAIPLIRRKPRSIVEEARVERYEITVSVNEAGKIIRLEVEPRSTIGSIVETIVRELDLPKADYVLAFGNRVFGKKEHSETLGSAGLKNGDALELRSTQNS